MLTRFRPLSLLVLFAILLTACNAVLTPAQSSNNLERIIQRGKLVIATDPSYPPQSERIEGETRPANTQCSPTEFTANQFSGFDVAVAVELAKRLGVEACFVTPTWEQIVAGGWSDQWDIHIGSMTITTERLDALYFPQPYYTSPAVFLVYQDETRFTQPSDLSGKKIGVCADCSYSAYLEGSLELPATPIEFVVADPIIVAYSVEMAALETLGQGSGRLDAILTAQVYGLEAINNGVAIKQLGEPVFNEYLSVAIDKKTTRNQLPFVQKVNELIQAMHSDGSLRQLSLDTYGVDLTTAASQFDIHSLGQIP
jgi:polar amino acid transport system substrate-binding protein